MVLEIFGGIFQWGNVWRRRRWRHSQDIVQNKQPAFYRGGASGIGGHGQYAAHREDSSTGAVSRKRDPAKLITANVEVGESIVPSQPLIQECVIAINEFHY